MIKISTLPTTPSVHLLQQSDMQNSLAQKVMAERFRNEKMTWRKTLQTTNYKEFSLPKPEALKQWS